MRLSLIGISSCAAIAWLIAASIGYTGTLPPQTENWLSYRNDTLNYSFKYPLELGLVHRSVPEFQMPGLVEIVDLVSRSESAPVLRVMVFETGGNRLALTYDFDFLKKVCKNYREFQVHGRTAVNCVTCGSAACSWTVHVPGEREYRIFPVTSNDHEKLSAEDGRFPLRSIIDSFKFSNKPQ